PSLVTPTTLTPEAIIARHPCPHRRYRLRFGKTTFRPVLGRPIKKGSCSEVRRKLKLIGIHSTEKTAGVPKPGHWRHASVAPLTPVNFLHPEYLKNLFSPPFTTNQPRRESYSRRAFRVNKRLWL